MKNAKYFLLLALLLVVGLIPAAAQDNVTLSRR